MDGLAARLAGTSWRVVELDWQPLDHDVTTTLTFGDGSSGGGDGDGDGGGGHGDGAPAIDAYGRGGVNRYRGRATVDGDVLRFGAMMSTLMAGPPAAMEQEHRWLSSLREPLGAAVVEATGGAPAVLELRRPDGSVARLHEVGSPITVTGTVTYRERIAMLPDSVVVVELEDTSRADAPARPVARAIVDRPGNVPVPFELVVDPADLRHGDRLALRARIEVMGRRRWTTDTAHPVDLGDEPAEHELVVVQAHHDEG